MDRDIQDPRNVRIDLLYKFFTIVCNNLTFLVISSFVNLRAFCGLFVNNFTLDNSKIGWSLT